jgi:hypothetical protein
MLAAKRRPATMLDNSCKKSMLGEINKTNGPFHQKHVSVAGTSLYREVNRNFSLKAILRKIFNKDNE